MEKLTQEHVIGLIEEIKYDIDPQVIVCKLKVGDAIIVGTSYCFHKSTHNPERGKEAAYKDALNQLFDLEAYHQKRLRSLYPDINGNEPTIDKTSWVTKTATDVGADILRDETTVDQDGKFVGRSVTYKCPHTGAIGYDVISAPGICSCTHQISPEEQAKAEELIQLQNRQTPAIAFVPTLK